MGIRKIWGHGKTRMELEKGKFEEEKESKKKEETIKWRMGMCIDRFRRKRSLQVRKKKFIDRWKRRVKGNIEKCQKQWD